MSGSSQPSHGSNTTGSHFQPSLAVVLVIIVAFVAATFLMLRTVSPSSSSGTTTTLPGGVTTTTLHRPPKSAVRVQVANGTSTPGLARKYTDQLLTLGWDTLPQLDGPHVKTTKIYYIGGYRWAAVEIANELKVHTSAVLPLDGEAIRALKPTIPDAGQDHVVVIIGPNLA